MTLPRAIVWDWDDTLVDGWSAIAAGLNAAFDAFGMPAWSVEETRARVRRSLRDSFPGIFGAEWERARDIFYREVRARHLQVVRAMPGAEAMLRVAARVGPMAVVSNKQGPLLRAEADKLGWTPRFRALVGAADTRGDKPDPAPLLLALAACGVRAGPEVWYVGDTALDMEAARRVGCRAVLLGNASHDGGAEGTDADVCYPNADALALDLQELASREAAGSPAAGGLALPARLG